MRCHFLGIQRRLLSGCIVGTSTLKVFTMVFCVQRQLEGLQDGGIVDWGLKGNLSKGEKKTRRKDVRIQNRSGVGRLLLYGVHRCVSRAAAYPPDLTIMLLL